MTLGNMARGLMIIAAFGLTATMADAGGRGNGGGGPPGGSSGGGGGGSTTPVFEFWMQSDVQDVWNGTVLGFEGQSYTGKGSTITVIDFYTGKPPEKIYGNLDGNITKKYHGEWTSMEAAMIAPDATIVKRDLNDSSAVALDPTAFNVFNASYADEYDSTLSLADIAFADREMSVMAAAQDGTAVVTKSAGNAGLNHAVGDTYNDAKGNPVRDYFGIALIGDPSAIFVGSLVNNGSTSVKGVMAPYSTVAGSDPTVQNQYLVVGVYSDEFDGVLGENQGMLCGSQQGTCLYGTSFAAPIVAGYAAIIGQKFGQFDANGTLTQAADPTYVARQLLDTARKDTLRDLGTPGWSAEDAATYGQGEACLSCALSPVSLSPGG